MVEQHCQKKGYLMTLVFYPLVPPAIISGTLGKPLHLIEAVFQSVKRVTRVKWLRDPAQGLGRMPLAPSSFLRGSLCSLLIPKLGPHLSFLSLQEGFLFFPLDGNTATPPSPGLCPSSPRPLCDTAVRTVSSGPRTMPSFQDNV